ncbi:MAG TPA: 50S ribosomal protein L22 [Saprospiraceae bacterium]|nr:50S ribosomal protein L22 [Saprospiraceae bacterium]
MEAVAKLRNVQMSARKMRLVVDNIRGKNVDDALSILRYTKKEAAVWLEKLVLSAIANWENKLDGLENPDDYDLYIKTAFVDQGPMLKRFRPAPHGRAHRIRKHSNHVTIIVENGVELPDEGADALVNDLSEEE